MSEEETKPIEDKTEEAADKKGNGVKTEKHTINKEDLERELQDGIRIEAKLYAPSEKHCQMAKYNLSDAEFLALLESLPQKRKARLILNFSKSAFDLVIFNSEVPDRKLLHHQIPMMWSPRHRGRPILGIAIEVNGKYDMVVLKLDDNKGEQFVNKVRFAYREKMVAPQEEEEGEEKKEEKAPEEGAKEEEKEKEEKSSGLADLVDFDAAPVERSDPSELFSDNSDWANFSPPEEKKTEAPSAALTDLFAAPVERPQPQFPSLAIPGPPSGKQSPANPFSAPAPAANPWVQSAPVQSFLAPPSAGCAFIPIPSTAGQPQPLGQAFGAMSVSNGALASVPSPSAPARFGGNGAFSAPNTPLLSLSSSGHSRLSPSLQGGGNPFAALDNNTSTGSNPFAGPDAPMSMGVVQPQSLKANKSSDSLDLFDVANPSTSQKGAPVSVTKFDDLLATANPGFQPNSQAHATPRDMFAAMQQKPKSLPLNDILTQ